MHVVDSANSAIFVLAVTVVVVVVVFDAIVASSAVVVALLLCMYSIIKLKYFSHVTRHMGFRENSVGERRS